MLGRIDTGLLCAALASAALVGGAQAEAQVALSAGDVPRLVAQAREGDNVSAARLDSWLVAARAGNASALALAADVVNAGIVTDEAIVADLERQAAAGDYDAHTGYLRSIVAGEARVTAERVAGVVGLTAGRSGTEAAGALAGYLSTDLTGRILLPSFQTPVLDPEDVASLIEDDNTEVNITSGGTGNVCKPINYYDALGNFTVMGMEVCITWKYDGTRYVGSASRTINPYVSVIGTASMWRWVGTNLAEKYYYNYARRGPRSGFHTKTIGHFQRCPSQFVVQYCDQDALPTITLNGHYRGTHSYAGKP